MDWDTWVKRLEDLVVFEKFAAVARATFLVLVVLPAVFLLAGIIRRWVTKRFSAYHGLIAAKVVRYSGVIIIVVLIFKEFGFSLSPLLGAAGIVGVALAFASQTSVSNIISGLFLIAEKSFAIGDVLTVNNNTGIVLSIDTLSVKMRTFDNRYIRIPNETMIKADLVNITRFPIRRVDVNVGVSYNSELSKVREALLKVARDNPLCLMEPKPLIVLSGFGESSIDLLFGVWATKDNFLALKNSIQEEIKRRFDEKGIEIPFPQRVVHYTADFPPANPLEELEKVVEGED